MVQDMRYQYVNVYLEKKKLQPHQISHVLGGIVMFKTFSALGAYIAEFICFIACACRVSSLNQEICQLSRIPVDKQVLLMSGGVPLFPEKPLAHYESFLVGNQYSVV